MFDSSQMRKDFPILTRSIGDEPLTYLDSAAASLVPQPVVERMQRFDLLEKSSVHRGAHFLADRATDAFEQARQKIADYINAGTSGEMIFCSGTTFGLNILARSLGQSYLRAGDEILVSEMEHHSNIVPWQMLSEQVGCRLRVIPINDAGELALDELPRLINKHTKLISVVHVSNSLGTINPVKDICLIAKEYGIPVIIDGAQAVPHLKVDVQDIGCDFYVFSSQKMLGPTGLGAVYMRNEWLERLPPVIGGGHMIQSVTFAKTTYAKGRAKFEPGTPHITGVIGFGAAIDYLKTVGVEKVRKHEEELTAYALERLQSLRGLRVIGQAKNRIGVISFVLDDVHAHDVGTILDSAGIAVRVGHHCCQPVMERFGVPATARASFYIYNTQEDVDRLCDGIGKVRDIFQ